MKQILIISFHSLPSDIIASYRANAYLKHLHKYGFQPTLLTHHWGADIRNEEIVEEKKHHGTVIRLPHYRYHATRFLVAIERIPVVNKVSILLRWLFGFLDTNVTPDIDSFYLHKSFLLKHLNRKKYDCVMGIFSPHYTLRLCYWIRAKFGIPYILDFRDLWHNRVIHKDYRPNLTERIQDLITKYYWKKWLQHALFFSITSEPWRSKINEFSKTIGIIITNGYDAEEFETEPITSTGFFRIIYGGKLYAQQNLTIFLRGSQDFIRQVQPDRFELIFYGSDVPGASNQISGFMHKPQELVSQYLDGEYYSFEDRIPKKELISQMKSSQALLFPGMPDAPGTHLGKIFDYLASGTNIILAPDDQDVVGALIRETNTGKIANTPDELCKQLTRWYEEWKSTGKIRWNGSQEAIGRYSRECQVATLSTHLKKYFV